MKQYQVLPIWRKTCQSNIWKWQWHNALLHKTSYRIFFTFVHVTNLYLFFLFTGYTETNITAWTKNPLFARKLKLLMAPRRTMKHDGIITNISLKKGQENCRLLHLHVAVFRFLFVKHFKKSLFYLFLLVLHIKYKKNIQETLWLKGNNK